MVLSFKSAVEGNTKEDAKPQFDLEVGKMNSRFPYYTSIKLHFELNLCICVTQKLEAKVLKKLDNSLEVAILPGDIRAVLPTMHLSDHISNCPLLWESLQEGDVISNLMSFSKKKPYIVSYS